MSLKDQAGVFSWFSLMSTDVSAVIPFYTQLLGWTTREYEIEGMGKSDIFLAAGQEFAGPVSLDRKHNIPSHWISYIAVEDVDDACKKGDRLGGQVCVPAFDIPSIGRTAVLTDPSGAAFHIYTPADQNEDLKKTGDKDGQICWMELMIDEPEKVLTYYSEMFAWKMEDPVEMGGGLYHTLNIRGEQAGGIMKRPPEAPAMPPAWIPYMRVSSIEESAPKVGSLGGKELLPRTEIPGTGYFSLNSDPSGACFYFFEFT